MYTTSIPADSNPVWEFSPILDGISLNMEGGGARLVIDDVDALVGEIITLRVVDTYGKYNVAEFSVEVIS